MRKVQISAPARLHLGFVGLHGDSAARFGALGLAIQRPRVVIEASVSSNWLISGHCRDRVERYVDILRREMKMDIPVNISVHEAIPAHAGLGSGTQLALAVGSACVALHQKDLSLEKLSKLLGRGRRSGIGTAAFECGGFLVDREAEASDESRALARRLPFPEDWRIILVSDENFQGMHGIQEDNAFQDLGGFSPELTSELQELLVNQALPALQNTDVVTFGSAITSIQNRVGDFFAPLQGGRYLSSRVADILAYAAADGAPGVGQSSWGPTGFIITGTESKASRLCDKLRRESAGEGIGVEICKARNKGASISIFDHEDASLTHVSNK